MWVRVDFVFNPATGTIDEFLIEDIDGDRSPDHDDEHDRIADEIGAEIDPLPDITQVGRPTHGPTGGVAVSRQAEAEAEARRNREAQ
jgi:hypothetical protein